MVGYPYGNGTYYVNDGIVRILVGLFAAALICAVMVRLALFALRSAGLYKIARRRGLRGAWLSWVPVGCDWILGSVADQYQYVVKGRIKNRRLPLLLLSAVTTGMGIVATVAGVSAVALYAEMIFGGMGYGSVVPTVWAVVLPILLWGSSVAYLVVRCIAVYDLYGSCTKKYNVLFLVLGLVFRFLEPLFFFICRNKEEGMPPRRETATANELEFQTEE